MRWASTLGERQAHCQKTIFANEKRHRHGRTWHCITRRAPTLRPCASRPSPRTRVSTQIAWMQELPDLRFLDLVCPNRDEECLHARPKERTDGAKLGVRRALSGTLGCCARPWASSAWAPLDLTGRVRAVPRWESRNTVVTDCAPCGSLSSRARPRASRAPARASAWGPFAEANMRPASRAACPTHHG